MSFENGRKQSLEMKEDKNAPVVSEADAELAEALRNYVPGTREEKQLVRKIDLYLVCLSPPQEILIEIILTRSLDAHALDHVHPQLCRPHKHRKSIPVTCSSPFPSWR